MYCLVNLVVAWTSNQSDFCHPERSPSDEGARTELKDPERDDCTDAASGNSHSTASCFWAHQLIRKDSFSKLFSRALLIFHVCHRHPRRSSSFALTRDYS